MPDNHPLIFKEQRWWVVACDLSLLLVTGACIWLNIYSFFLDTIDHDATGRIITLFLLFTFCPLVFLGRTSLGDIHVDDDGIGFWIWGRQWKYIRWADVKNLTLITIPTYVGNNRIQTAYSLFIAGKKSSLNSLRCGMSFYDDRPQTKALIDAVNRYIQQNHIEVIDKRTQVITPTA
jgi:hypothetical protein